MNLSFKGKKALVTGAAQGIGRRIAFKLAQCGASVIAIDRDKAKLAGMTAQNSAIQTAVVDLKDWKRTDEVVKGLCPIDLLVNNAGVGTIGPLSTATSNQYEEIFSVNVKALINVTKVVVQNLVSRKAPGSIVNISSHASKAGLLGHSVYCASKGAVDAFTRAAALEYGPHNIRFNCVNPTVVLTELGKRIWSDPKMGEPMLAMIPKKRFAEVDDIVPAVLFLLSEKADMITGSSICVDGGFIAR